MRRNLGRIVLFGMLLALPLASALDAAHSSYQLVDQAYQAGELTNNERLILLVQSIHEPEQLPVRFRADQPEVAKSGTEILMEVSTHWDRFNDEEQALLRTLLARPSLAHSYDSPGGEFKIHYNTTGGDAVPTTDVNPANGVPDYVDWLADYADSSFRTEITYLGHNQPPIDYGFGGDNRYDIYIEDMPYYGYTQPENPGNYPWNDYYSYIGIENNFYGFPSNDDPDGDQKGAMKVTIAHEYYHAIQMGYEVSFSNDVWFMEISSTWMEEWAFAPVNDNYWYLSDWFSSPYKSLHENSSHAYAAFIWAKYLEENFGAQIMQGIWAHTIGNTPYQDLTAILANYSTTLEDEFSEFCIWNYITGSYDDGLHYEDAADYPSMQILRNHANYPVSGQTPTTSARPDGMGANYINFNLPSGPGEFVVDFDGDNATPWRVKLLTYVYSGGDVFGEHEMVLDGNGDGSFTLADPENWSRVIMIVVNVSQTLNDRTYVYGASFTPFTGYAIDVRSEADDSVYSNTSTHCYFEIENTGVYGDVFDIDVDNSLGWTVTATPGSIYLNPGVVDTVNVNVICPPATMPDLENLISLSATATSTIGADDLDSCTVQSFIMHGDADNNGFINISDATYLIAYIFGGGPAPVPVDDAGDADCNTLLNISDAVALIDYIFGGGTYPPCNPF